MKVWKGGRDGGGLKGGRKVEGGRESVSLGPSAWRQVKADVCREAFEPCI